MLPSKAGRVPISTDDFWKNIQMLFQILWVVVFYLKIFDCCSLTILMQHKPDWSKMDVIILTKEFLHIQIYITESKPLNIPPVLLKFIYRNKACKAISNDCFHEKHQPASKRISTGFFISSLEIETLPTFDGSTLVMSRIYNFIHFIDKRMMKRPVKLIQRMKITYSLFQAI